MRRTIGQLLIDLLLSISAIAISILVRCGYNDFVWSKAFLLNTDILFVLVTSLFGIILTRLLENIYSCNKIYKTMQIVVPALLTAYIFIIYFFGFKPTTEEGVAKYYNICISAIVIYFILYSFEMWSIVLYYKKQTKSNNSNGKSPNELSYTEE